MLQVIGAMLRSCILGTYPEGPSAPMQRYWVPNTVAGNGSVGLYTMLFGHLDLQGYCLKEFWSMADIRTQLKCKLPTGFKRICNLGAVVKSLRHSTLDLLVQSPE